MNLLITSTTEPGLKTTTRVNEMGKLKPGPLTRQWASQLDGGGWPGEANKVVTQILECPTCSCPNVWCLWHITTWQWYPLRITSKWRCRKMIHQYWIVRPFCIQRWMANPKLGFQTDSQIMLIRDPFENIGHDSSHQIDVFVQPFLA